MDKDVAQSFTNISKQITDLSVQVGKLEQKNLNGDKQKDKEIKQKANRFSYDRLIVSIIVGVFGIYEVLEKMGIIK